MADFKLYPPLIGSKIPAFYQDDSDNLIITVSFVNNRSVSLSDISAFTLRLKTIQTDWVVVTDTINNSNKVREAFETGNITFVIPKEKYQKESESWKINVGQFYKIQLAYRDKDGELGYYSSVGISKFSFYPEVSIEKLNKTSATTHSYNYIGRYSQKYQGRIMDPTEKVYNYRFIITNNITNTIIKDTDWLLHDSGTDEDEATSFDNFEYLNELPAICTIQYLVKTTSGIEAKSPKYLINPTSTRETDELMCKAENNFDDGYIKIEASGSLAADNYYIVRNKKNSDDRCKIANITLGNSFKDFTVEQGEEYEYRIYASTGDFSASSLVEADYEDIFLFDGEKQLKIRFNPNVNSLTETIMESKIDTIGGKYPIFLRNGDTRYFTFSFGGLITYNMDEKGFFDIGFTKPEYTRESTNTNQEINLKSTTSQNAYNYKREREFREKVLNWLNDGKPKLFRSPTEGIKMVRLSGNNLSPNQQISRMIWSFTSTATEIDYHDYEALIKHKIYKL